MLLSLQLSERIIDNKHGAYLINIYIHAKLVHGNRGP